jgi:carbonic anhydrase
VRAPAVFLCLGSLCLGSLVACTSDDTTADPGEDQVAEHSWSYAEPAAWPSTCATGKQQSPVDLTGATGEDLADVTFNYAPGEVTVTNTGHTALATYAPGSSIELDGVTYELVQFHVHAPSEHLVDGEEAAAELHLVHQAADGTLAVVGVLVTEGVASTSITPYLDAIPDDVDAEASAGEIDAADLLPESPLSWRYDGSLTTPPCTEGVHWTVMEEPVTWSAEQIAAVAERYAGSHRPVQPLGERELVADTSG